MAAPAVASLWDCVAFRSECISDPCPTCGVADERQHTCTSVCRSRLHLHRFGYLLLGGCWLGWRFFLDACPITSGKSSHHHSVLAQNQIATSCFERISIEYFRASAVHGFCSYGNHVTASLSRRVQRTATCFLRWNSWQTS